MLSSAKEKNPPADNEMHLDAGSKAQSSRSTSDILTLEAESPLASLSAAQQLDRPGAQSAKDVKGWDFHDHEA